MRKKAHIYILLISIFFIISIIYVITNYIYAKEVVSTNLIYDKKYKDSLTLNATEVYSLKLDSITAPEEVSYFQNFTDHKGHAWFTFLNAETNAIYFYNFLTGELDKIVKLEDLGFEHASIVMGYNIINEDSMLVYCYGNTSISMVNLNERKKIFTKSIVPVTGFERSVVYPFINVTSPVLYNNETSEVYLAGATSDEFGSYESDQLRQVLATLNCNTGSIKFSTRYPQFYWGVNWGGISGFREVSVDMDAHNKVIINFKADHNITVYDPLVNSSKQYYAGSKYFKNINSLPYSTWYYELLSKNEIKEYVSQNPSYSSIKYDKYRKLYYRIAQLPIKNVDITSKKGTEKQPSVIILNEKLEKVGEVLLPNHQYDIYKFFIAEDGLYIKMKNSTDDLLSFQLFKITTKPSNNL